MQTKSQGGKRPGSGRKKGTPNKATVARQVAQFYTSEAIEALRSVCADSSADEMARVQAACKLIDLLPSQLLRTKGALPEQCSHQHLADAINGCLRTGEHHATGAPDRQK